MPQRIQHFDAAAQRRVGQGLVREKAGDALGIGAPGLHSIGVPLARQHREQSDDLWLERSQLAHAEGAGFGGLERLAHLHLEHP